MNAKRFIPAAVLAAFVAIGGSAVFAGEASFVFRSRPMIIVNGEAPPEDSTETPPEDMTMSASLAVPSPFGLTLGSSIAVPLNVSGNTSGVTYEAAPGAAMPGLSVDPSTGEVTGTPVGTAGTPFTVSVVAMRGGEVVAQDSFVRTLRQPLEITAVPPDIRFIKGEAFPATTAVAQSSGGDESSVEWALSNAPDWLEVVRDGPANHARLRVKEGHAVAVTDSADVTLAASDGEGRSSEREFVLAVMPGPEVLVPDGSVAGKDYGIAASISGDTAVVGAYKADAVYVFKRQPDNTWVQVQKLVGNGGSWFGYALALRDDMLVVGATTGLYAEVFKKQANGTFSSIQTLTGTAGSRYGYSVATDGHAVVIGAFKANKAFVYEIQPDLTLSLTATLEGSVTGGYFGDSVAVDGDTIFVGGYNGGTMTVFGRQPGGSWEHVANFTGTVGDVSGGLFGYRVAVKGNTGFFTHNKDNATGFNAGSAWVVERQPDGSWAMVQKLTASNPVSGARFGVSIAFDGEVAIIGSLNGDHAYAFRRSGGSWVQSSILQFPGTASGSASYISVSMSDDKAVVTLGGTTGTAYVLPTP